MHHWLLLSQQTSRTKPISSALKPLIQIQIGVLARKQGLSTMPRRLLRSKKTNGTYRSRSTRPCLTCRLRLSRRLLRTLCSKYAAKTFSILLCSNMLRSKPRPSCQRSNKSVFLNSISSLVSSCVANKRPISMKDSASVMSISCSMNSKIPRACNGST